jgi:predicted Zn-dependent peptidase
MANGMRLATASLEHSECASMAIYLPVGSRHDPPKLAGLAHFMEHMAFKGTARRNARQLSLDLENTGAQANACTTEDHTVYDARGIASCLPSIAEILSDMMWNSSLPPREIALERDVIREEITMYEENPGDHIGDMISHALWSPDPLGQRITGTHKTLSAITRSDLFTFCQEHHFSHSVVIAAAGPFSAGEFAEMIQPHLPANAHPPTTAASSYQAPNTARTPLIEHRDTEQLQLALAWQTPGRHHPGRHALRLLSMVLGESSSSRLFQVLREQRGLCYSLGSDVALFSDVGSLEICAGLDPESRDEALAAIQKEIHQLVTQGPSQEELERAKRIALTTHKIALESTSAQMFWVAESVLFEGKIVTPEEELAKMDPITPEDVRAIAQEVFHRKNLAHAEIRAL